MLRGILIEWLVLGDTVEDIAIYMMVMAVDSQLVRGDILDMPSSIHMMGFID